MLNQFRPLDTRLPEMLRSGRRLRGIFNPFPSPAIVEMCAFAGFDFVVIDNEHGTSGFETTEHMLRAARASGIATVVRCLEQDIARTLDMGAGGLLIPMVNDAARAKQIVTRIKYPQSSGRWNRDAGGRGSSFGTRAAGHGAFGGSEHLKLSNEGVALLVQIENPEAVSNASEIASVDGVDCVFVGSNDLAHSMGFENRGHEAAVQTTIERALKAVAAAGKCAGIPAFSLADEQKYAEWGARCFANGVPGLIMKAFKEAASSAHDRK